MIDAVVLLVIDRLNFGIAVDGLPNTLITAAVIALLQLVATPFVKIADIVTFSVVTWLLNWVAATVILVVADKLLPGFKIASWLVAIIGAAIMAFMVGVAHVFLP